MTPLQTELLEAVLENEADMGNPTFNWKGNDYICLPNTFTDSIKSDVVGYNLNSNIRIRIRINQFTNGVLPALNDVITYLGNKLQIEQVKTPANGVFVILVCSKLSTGK